MPKPPEDFVGFPGTTMVPGNDVMILFKEATDRVLQEVTVVVAKKHCE